ncbi:hypothetical protein GCM10010195_36900 [Kitasatospora griseola]|nr:hypothetical protein GCM10010195_36900 [Kitasatospora griseola]
MLDDVPEYVVEYLADPGGVLIVDDTGFLKKGVRSAGVQRQYSGTAGRLEQADVFYVVATTRHDTVVTRRALHHPLHDLMADLPRQKWKRRFCCEGTHGLRLHDWARVEVRPRHRPDRRHWVLTRRNITDPTKIAYYIAVVGARWAVEKCFQTAKGQCGLDDYQI